MDIYYIVSNLLVSPSLWMATALFIVGYTWTTKVDNVDRVMAAHVNLLQGEKIDRDGEIPFTGTSQWDKGNDIASAATLAPGADGNYFDVTGTTGITAINAVRSQPGTVIKLHFDGIVLITHHATNLIMPNGANYTTAAGDELEFVEYAANQWRCTNISPPLGGGVGANYTVTAKTNHYNVLAADFGINKALSMEHADPRTFTLPSVDAGNIGYVLTFIKLGAGQVTIDAADADTIHDSSAGGTIYNAQAGETYATITLMLVSATQWAITGVSGIGWITT